jgi:hypothetical protein
VTAEQRAVNADGRPAIVHLNRDTCATIHPRLAHADVATVEVQATTIGELLARHGVHRAALVKLDIEGAELEILEAIDSATLARVDQLTVEFHDFIDPGQSAAVVDAIERMRRAGFLTVKFSRDNSDVLFINRDRLRITAWQRLWIIGRYKYPRGIVRIATRWLNSRK